LGKTANPAREVRFCVTFTVEEVAKLLRISRWAAYEAVKRGELPTITLGRRILVPRRVVERLLSDGNSEPAA
jgi:excisionase family DNA binding protein